MNVVMVKPAGLLLALIPVLPAFGASGPVDAPGADDIVVERAPTPQAVTFSQRLSWFASSSFGPPSLAGGVISAGFGTLLNRPREYGPHWEGFGDRYGMRMTGVVTSSAMEAGLGAIWGEDPRYARAGVKSSFKARAGRVAKWTFFAPGSNGALHPAYARYMAIGGSNFLSNSWRESSESGVNSALLRTAEGFGARMAGNAFAEFWPDLKKKVFHRAAHD